MVSYLKDILKNQLVELFDDVLRLNTITNKQRCILELGRELTERTDSSIIMSHLSEELVDADLDSLGKNSEDLFNYIFNCLTKKQVKNEFFNDSFKELYQQLTDKEKETIMDYAKQMKKICEKYNCEKNDKSDSKLNNHSNSDSPGLLDK
jgi:hypothetical protein